MGMGGELNAAVRSLGVDLYADFDPCYIPYPMRWTNGISFIESRPTGKLLADPTTSPTSKSFGRQTGEDDQYLH